MITTTAVLIISCLLAVFMLSNKQRELLKGKAIFRLGTENTDHALERIWTVYIDRLSRIHPESLKHPVRRFVVEFEKHVMNIFHKLSYKFSIVGDVVTGRDIPKNRGSVSFFLKNIEDSKKQSSL